MNGPVVLDSDILSELARGNPAVVANARSYLEHFGRLTFTAVTVFERLRGYQAAIVAGKPYERARGQFEALVAASLVLPFEQSAAARAAAIWSAVGRKQHQALGDIFIAAIASVRGLPLVTRNRCDFEPIAELNFVNLQLVDWAR